MDDLISRLTAAIDETERIARAACHETGGEWTHTDPDRHPGGVDDAAGGIVVYDEGSPTQAQAAHIVRHDPASVLRGCAADRKILAIHKPLEVFTGSSESKYWPPHAVGRTVFVCECCDDHDSENGWQEDEKYPCATVLAVAERYVLEVDGG